MSIKPDKATVSRRLKAGRWLAGGLDAKGKAAALPVSELAKHPLLQDNGISANRLEEIEQMTPTPRPMELEKVATALGLPADWFVREDPVRRTDDPFDVLERGLADLGLVLSPGQAADASDDPDTDRPEEGLGGGGA